MSPRAIHTVLTEKQLTAMAAKDQSKKAVLDTYKEQCSLGKNVIVITDRHGQLALQELTPKMG